MEGKNGWVQADLVQGAMEVCFGNSDVEGLLLGRYGIMKWQSNLKKCYKMWQLIRQHGCEKTH